MAKPTHVPVWATAALYTTNPDPVAVGEATKLDPGSLAVQGWTHVSRPNPRHFNYWQNEVGAWLGWVDNDVFSTEGGSFTLLDAFAITGGSFAMNLEVTHPAGEQFFENGELVVTATGQIRWQSGAELTLDAGAVADINTGAEVAFNSGSDLTFASGSDISGAARFSSGTWTQNAPMVLGSTITNTGAGHLVPRIVAGSDADVTYGINDYDEIMIPVLTGDRVYTLSTTGAVNGVRIRFNAWMNSSIFTVSITTPEGLHTLRAASAHTAMLEVVYFAGAWHRSIMNLF